jgi:hypothetical protein
MMAIDFPQNTLPPQHYELAPEVADLEGGGKRLIPNRSTLSVGLIMMATCERNSV